MSDEALLDHIRRGSEPHFGELYNRYFQRIYTFAYVRVRNHADAEEIAQETFTAVFRSIGAFGGRSTLLSWIYGIAKNTANNHLRRAKPHDARIDDLDESVIATTDAFESSRPDEEFELHAYARTVAARLDKLAPWQVDAFCMRHFDNLSIPEICERTDRSSDAVRSSLYRVKRVFLETVGAEAR
ncbi:MAG: RNA polymerase sigma factor [Myxococcota bacterium]|nr:RNA polymerase sigma factor [Myxococcales bacterium]